MRQFLVDEFSKFKIEVVELIQYVSKFKTLTMNIQTYLSINILVLLGIEANIFMCSVLLIKHIIKSTTICYLCRAYSLCSFVLLQLHAIELL